MLTGSTMVNEDEIEHSGADRIARLQMRPMSLYESEDSNGMVSLKTVFEGEHQIAGLSDLSVKDIANIISRGG